MATIAETTGVSLEKACRAVRATTQDVYGWPEAAAA